MVRKNDLWVTVKEELSLTLYRHSCLSLPRNRSWLPSERVQMTWPTSEALHSQAFPHLCSFTFHLSPRWANRTNPITPTYPLLSSLCPSFCLCGESPPSLPFLFYMTPILPTCQSPAQWPPAPERPLVLLPPPVVFVTSSHSTTGQPLCSRTRGSPPAALPSARGVTFSLPQCPRRQSGNNNCLPQCIAVRIKGLGVYQGPLQSLAHINTMLNLKKKAKTFSCYHYCSR